MAASGAQGVALALMVCHFSISKEEFHSSNYISVPASLKKSIFELSNLKSKFLELAEEDMKCFKRMMALSSRQEKEYYEAVAACINVSIQVMSYAVSALKICNNLIGESNENLVSDLAIAAQMLRAVVEGSIFNIYINLGAVPASYKEECNDILSLAEDKAQSARILSDWNSKIIGQMLKNEYNHKLG